MLSTNDVHPAAAYKRLLGRVLGDSQRQQRFSKIVDQTYARFIQCHPQVVDTLFDTWFISHQAAPVLNRFLYGNDQNSAWELAAAWEKQMGGSDKGRAQRVAALQPTSAKFLTMLQEAWCRTESLNHAW